MPKENEYGHGQFVTSQQVHHHGRSCSRARIPPPIHFALLVPAPLNEIVEQNYRPGPPPPPPPAALSFFRRRSSAKALELQGAAAGAGQALRPGGLRRGVAPRRLRLPVLIAKVVQLPEVLAAGGVLGVHLGQDVLLLMKIGPDLFSCFFGSFKQIFQKSSLNKVSQRCSFPFSHHLHDQQKFVELNLSTFIFINFFNDF
mmetsp:Transcript_53942/g.78795  ORF Transcript_53942/g.78795 Transcript_53942/m.78795 type:complete len:200 (-) Transcript_53942:508-1107(-)